MQRVPWDSDDGLSVPLSSFKLLHAATLSRQRPRVRVPSSPPFIPKQLVNGASTSAYPQFHPQSSLDTPGFESHGVQEFLLSRDHLVEVLIRVKVKRGLNPSVTQNALHGLRILLRLVHQPVRQAVPQVVETPAMPVRDYLFARRTTNSMAH